MSYLIDDGFRYPEQLRGAHSILLETEKRKGGFRHTGAMGFDTDERVVALQAADVIAWSARRKEIDGQLTNEFAPLEKVLSGDPAIPEKARRAGAHRHISILEKGIEDFAKTVNTWLEETGKPPDYEDFLRGAGWEKAV